jgi:hypothetical protein
MNPNGIPLWISDVLPGSVRDLPAARTGARDPVAV